MKVFFAFVQKEFYHIFRDKQTILILLFMPVVQILLFGYAITTEIQKSEIAVYDLSEDPTTQRISDQLSNSLYFTMHRITKPEQIAQNFQSSSAKAQLIFSENFESNLYREGNAKVQIIADASDPNEANILTNYLRQIILSYDLNTHKNQVNPPAIITAESTMLYNPQLKSAYNFVPGVMGLVLMLICTLMTSVSIVREKELNTMEVLLVSPLKPIYIVFSKAVPYLVLSLINVLTIILLSVLILDVPIVGSIALLLFACTLYILVSLAMGIFISTISPTQQIAMIISLIGLMLPTVLLSGLMFPIENMPIPLQVFSQIVPAKWFIEMVRMIMIKGLGLQFVWLDLVVLCGMLVLFFALSIKRFKIRLS